MKSKSLPRSLKTTLHGGKNVFILHESVMSIVFVSLYYPPKGTTLKCKVTWFSKLLLSEIRLFLFPHLSGQCGSNLFWVFFTVLLKIHIQTMSKL